MLAASLLITLLNATAPSLPEAVPVRGHVRPPAYAAEACTRSQPCREPSGQPYYYTRKGHKRYPTMPGRAG